MNAQIIIGIIASIATAAALLPQLLKVVREKKASDISVLMMLVIFIGNCLWIYYGYLGEDPIIIVSNAVSCVLNVLLFIYTVKYKSPENVK